MLCTVLLALSAAATSSAQSQQPHKGQDQSSEASSPNGQTDSANSQAAPTGSLSIAAHHEAGAVHIENGPPANERQTAAQERTARYTCWIVIFTAVMAVGTWAAAAVVLLYTHHAKRQAKAMEGQLAAMDRPFLKADLSMKVPLVFFDGGGKDDIAEVACDLSITNVGQSVATAIGHWVDLFVYSGEDRGSKQMEERVRCLIRFLGRFHEAGKREGFALFPGDPPALIPEVSMTLPGEIRDRILSSRAPDWAVNHAMFGLVGGVIYFGPNSDISHYTTFGYSIVRRIGKDEEFSRAEYLELGRSFAPGELELVKAHSATIVT